MHFKSLNAIKQKVIKVTTTCSTISQKKHVGYKLKFAVFGAFSPVLSGSTFKPGECEYVFQQLEKVLQMLNTD